MTAFLFAKNNCQFGRYASNILLKKTKSNPKSQAAKMILMPQTVIHDEL